MKNDKTNPIALAAICVFYIVSLVVSLVFVVGGIVTVWSVITACIYFLIGHH